jgi:uncharacterized HAD superfamily protein
LYCSATKINSLDAIKHLNIEQIYAHGEEYQLSMGGINSDPTFRYLHALTGIVENQEFWNPIDKSEYDLYRPNVIGLISLNQEDKTNLKKIILIDLDGTLTDTAHEKFKPYKDGLEETDLSKIPLIPGAK